MSVYRVRRENSIVVDAPAEDVWRAASDVPRYPEWVEATLEMLEPCPEAVPGAVYVERTRVVGPLTTIGRWTVVERDDDEMFQRHECADEPGPVKGMWIEMRVSAAPQTCFSVAIGCNVAAGPVSPLLGRLLARRLGAGNAGNVERFARLVTTQPPPTPGG